MKIRLLFYLLFVVAAAQAQDRTLPVTTQALQQYDRYREPLITTRLFKHQDVETLIAKHHNLLKDEVIGSSMQDRAIHHLTLGKGRTKVLLWSQMHGDEATATMALFDLFNFLSTKDEYRRLKKMLLRKLELHIVPMLNPDGAQIWTRTNAMKIDINRDAQNLATPEAKALMELAKRIRPDFGFNLHDQSTYYAAGKNTAKPASISFLAPAFNTAKDMDETRQRAVQVIVSMNNAIQTQIPNQVAKYNDTFDESCFGDTFQGMGISTILIETGGYPGDPDKQVLRKVNFHAILTALTAMAQKSYVNEEAETYWNLPNNFNNLHDVIFRNLTLSVDGKTVQTDLAINRQQRVGVDGKTFYYIGEILKNKKLDSAFAYQDIDAGTFTLETGKIKVMTEDAWTHLKPEEESQLLMEGYLFVKLENATSPIGPIRNRLLNLINNTETAQFSGGGPANFILYKQQKPYYAVVNGYVLKLDEPVKALWNTMGY
ncbi:MAG: M14 family metallopeptidase [Pedobacter sp.]|nr:M14 family metallopeptidase [Pedobacter sp.]MDQ8052627.1 M14 family metallopeptidase [Pedobacter sp.]